MLFDLTLFFKIIVSILIVICLFFLVRQIYKRRLSGIIINTVLLIILIILLCVPNYMKKLPIQAKEVVKISDNGLVNSKMLIIATTGTYYPWNYVTKSGSLEGFDIDITREIAKRMHLKPDFVMEPVQSLVTNLSHKQYDVVIFSELLTPNIKDKVDFSIPYAQIKNTFFSKNNEYRKYINADLLTLKKVLKGKIVGAQGGTHEAVYLSNEFKDIVKVKYFSTQSQLMTEVAAGRVDVGLSPIFSIVKFMKQTNKNIIIFGPKFNINDNPFLGKGISIAVAKGNKILLQKVNEALQSMQQDNTIKSFSIKYFSDDISYCENNSSIS